MISNLTSSSSSALSDASQSRNQTHYDEASSSAPPVEGVVTSLDASVMAGREFRIIPPEAKQPENCMRSGMKLYREQKHHTHSANKVMINWCLRG